MTQVQTKDSRVFTQTIQRLEDWKAELEAEIDKKYSSLKEIDYKVIVAKKSILSYSKTILEDKHGMDIQDEFKLSKVNYLNQKINEDFQKADSKFEEKDKITIYEIDTYKEIIKEIESYIQATKK